MSEPDPLAHIRQARMIIAKIVEPGDRCAALLLAELGAVRTAEICQGSALSQHETQAVVPAGDKDFGSILERARQNWAPRAQGINVEQISVVSRTINATVLIPEDPGWPAQLLDLAQTMPIALWLRGERAEQTLHSGLGVEHEGLYAIVGSRDGTAYGMQIARTLSSELVSEGMCVVSGGAYGIDAAAHRGALSVQSPQSRPRTIAVLAGGVDRLYPAGNTELLEQVAQDSLIISEISLGGTATKWRFLQRNRIIAALVAAIVVPEARWRSGALSTAHHGLSIGREVGAFPGSVYSSQSAGTHRLITESGAQLVSNTEQVLALTHPFSVAQSPTTEPIRKSDGLEVEDFLVLEALPKTRGAAVPKLAVVSGLSEPMVRASLGRLHLLGKAAVHKGLWKIAA